MEDVFLFSPKAAYLATIKEDLTRFGIVVTRQETQKGALPSSGGCAPKKIVNGKQTNN